MILDDAIHAKYDATRDDNNNKHLYHYYVYSTHLKQQKILQYRRRDTHHHPQEDTRGGENRLIKQNLMPTVYSLLHRDTKRTKTEHKKRSNKTTIINNKTDDSRKTQ
jgi:hypothetical protein